MAAHLAAKYSEAIQAAEIENPVLVYLLADWTIGWSDSHCCI
jgi:hypothetical protein